MRNYTVCATTAAVEGDNWDAHYDFLDDIPGSSLVENPSAPRLTFDIDARNWSEAQIFTLGLTSLLGLKVKGLEKLDESASVGDPIARHVEMVDNWVASSPKREACV